MPEKQIEESSAENRTIRLPNAAGYFCVYFTFGEVSATIANNFGCHPHLSADVVTIISLGAAAGGTLVTGRTHAHTQRLAQDDPSEIV